MIKKTRKPLQLDEETHQRVKQLSRELSMVEKRDVSMREVVSRVIKGKDIPSRLKLGSKTRRVIR